MTSVMSEQPCPDRELTGPDELLRWVHPALYDQVSESLDPAVFKNFPNPEFNRCSANWAECSTVHHTIRGRPGHGVASIRVQVCWEEEQEVERAAEENNPAHCNIVGDKPGSRRRRLAKAATVLRVPD